ncbi:MAG: hypothetical protein MZV64_22985 [Ignavibacteriales bacterium]|nr:hypothetical protein [Ignavibacteriales bacterium]
MTYLPQDFGEPVCTEAAMDYARAIEQGGLPARSLITPTTANIPPWWKLTYGIAAYFNGSAHNYSRSLRTGTRCFLPSLASWGLSLSSRSSIPLLAD